MSDNPVQITVITATSPEFGAVLDAWPSDSGLTRQQVAWKLTRSPYGCAWILGAIVNSEIAAMLVFGRIRTHIQGQVVESALVYQTHTSPAWRRRGLMTSLLEFATANASEEGFSLLLALPNPQSLGIYRKAGFEKRSFMRGWIGPRARYVGPTLRAIKSRAMFLSIPKQPVGPQDLPAHTIGTLPADPGYAYSERTMDFLEWRLGGYPQSDYKVLRIAETYVICRDGLRGNLPERQILSISSPQEHQAVHALRRVRQDFAGLVSLSVSDGPWRKQLLSQGFLPTTKGAPFCVLGVDPRVKNPLDARFYLDGLDVHTW